MKNKVFNSVLFNLLADNKQLDTQTKSILQDQVQNVDFLNPLFVTPSDSDLNKWGSSLEVTEIDLPGNGDTPERIHPLHDGTFLVVNSDGPSLHYSSSFDLISSIPFEYIAPSTNSEGYLSPDNSFSAEYEILSDTRIQGTVIGMVMSANHCVQMYKYEGGQWSFLSTLGTIDTSGNSTGNLDQPVAADGEFNKDEGNLNVFVSCHGAAPNAELSFIKKVSVGLTGTVISESVISYPGIYITNTDQGSLLQSETSNVTALRVKGNSLYVSSTTNKEFGILDISNPTSLKTLTMLSGKIDDIPFDDTFGIPTDFDVQGSVYVGDDKGHLGVMSADLSSLITYFGKYKAVGETTTYPLEFGSIDCVSNKGLTYFVSEGKVWKSNPGGNETVEVVLSPQIVDYGYYVKDVVGFVSGKDYLLSNDGINFITREKFLASDPYVSAGTPLKIKIVKNAANESPLESGYVIAQIEV